MYTDRQTVCYANEDSCLKQHTHTIERQSNLLARSEADDEEVENTGKCKGDYCFCCCCFCFSRGTSKLITPTDRLNLLHYYSAPSINLLISFRSALSCYCVTVLKLMLLLMLMMPLCASPLVAPCRPDERLSMKRQQQQHQ